jgi:hypothetical protein
MLDGKRQLLVSSKKGQILPRPTGSFANVLSRLHFVFLSRNFFYSFLFLLFLVVIIEGDYAIGQSLTTPSPLLTTHFPVVIPNPTVCDKLLHSKKYENFLQRQESHVIVKKPVLLGRV